MRSPTRPTTVLSLAMALLVASALAYSWHGTADAKSAPGLSKAEVESIAKNQAKKAIKKAAPKLTVRRAKNADRVDNRSIASLGATVVSNGAAVPWGRIGGLSLVAVCPSGDPTLRATASGGTLVWDHEDVATTATSFTTADVASGPYGSGMLHYKPPSGSVRVAAIYGWNSDGLVCQFYGQMIGG